MTLAPTVPGRAGRPQELFDAITLGSKPHLLRSHQRHIGQLPVAIRDLTSDRPPPTAEMHEQVGGVHFRGLISIDDDYSLLSTRRPVGVFGDQTDPALK